MSDKRFNYGHIEGLWFETEEGFDTWKSGIKEETMAKLIIIKQKVEGIRVLVLWQPDPIECALKMERVLQKPS